MNIIYKLKQIQINKVNSCHICPQLVIYWLSAAVTLAEADINTSTGSRPHEPCTRSVERFTLVTRDHSLRWVTEHTDQQAPQPGAAVRGTEGRAARLPSSACRALPTACLLCLLCSALGSYLQVSLSPGGGLQLESELALLSLVARLERPQRRLVGRLQLRQGGATVALQRRPQLGDGGDRLLVQSDPRQHRLRAQTGSQGAGERRTGPGS